MKRVSGKKKRERVMTLDPAAGESARPDTSVHGGARGLAKKFDSWVETREIPSETLLRHDNTMGESETTQEDRSGLSPESSTREASVQSGLNKAKYSMSSLAVAEFGGVEAFYGGLDSLIGPPHPDLAAELYAEHNNVTNEAEFGCSMKEFTAHNFKTHTTPAIEFAFVVEAKIPVSTGGNIRIPTSIDSIFEDPVKRMADFGLNVTREEFASIGLLKEEVIALRLYTGPMYTLYNAVLRNKGKGQYRGKFTTTIHLINSGILKLSKLQFCTVVYRGISGRVLPDAFREPNKYGVRGGVEFGFMSCTTDRNVALGYASHEGEQQDCLHGTVLEIRMGMFHKGAQMNWLSQYSHEGEILYAPLTGLEVIGDSYHSDNLEIWPVQLTTNLQSMEIEKLINLRRTHHMHTLQILHRELRDENIPQNAQQSFVRHMRAMEDKDGQWYNNDANFSSAIVVALEEKHNALSFHGGPLQASFDASRELPNEFSGDEPLIPLHTLYGEAGKILKELLDTCPPVSDNTFITISSVPEKNDSRPSDVYIGPTGLALVFLRAAMTESRCCTASVLEDGYQLSKEEHQRRAEKYFKTASQFLQSAMAKINTKRKVQDIGFHCSTSGPYALGAVISYLAGNLVDFKQFVELLVNLGGQTDVDELLYGRAGYLYALVFVLGAIYKPDKSTDLPSILPPEIKSQANLLRQALTQTFQELLKRGGDGEDGKPLTWTFQIGVSGSRNNYLGAAHGDAGILLTMLQAQPYILQRTWTSCRQLVQRSVDYLISRQLPDGNFPRSVKNNQRHLVHWCHGAPGVTALICEAYCLFKDPKYLAAARRCGEVCWHRGVLKKGTNLCHGLSGNAYTFLSLARLENDKTAALKDSNHYFRASCFARLITGYVEPENKTLWKYLGMVQYEMEGFQDRQRHAVGVPDFPYSLFEGKAGVACFLLDMLYPSVSHFPAYELCHESWASLQAFLANSEALDQIKFQIH
eukprot:m.44904 g.44904  ORF g.44904 m.44904 type:complete len:978 (+) comp10159_c0_seq1:184-3117(+)